MAVYLSKMAATMVGPNKRRAPKKPVTSLLLELLRFDEFSGMPFELAVAPATFKHLMERCMGGVNLYDCLIYLMSLFEDYLCHLEAPQTEKSILLVS